VEDNSYRRHLIKTKVLARGHTRSLVRIHRCRRLHMQMQATAQAQLHRKRVHLPPSSQDMLMLTSKVPLSSPHSKGKPSPRFLYAHPMCCSTQSWTRCRAQVVRAAASSKNLHLHSLHSPSLSASIRKNPPPHPGCQQWLLHLLSKKAV
jgi:hypothetical protein